MQRSAPIPSRYSKQTPRFISPIDTFYNKSKMILDARKKGLNPQHPPYEARGAWLHDLADILERSDGPHFDRLSIKLVLVAVDNYGFKWEDLKDYHEALIGLTRRWVDEFDRRDLSQVLNAFVHFGITQWEWFVDNDLADGLVKSVKNKADKFNTTDLSLVLNAFSHFDTQWQWFVDNDLADRLIKSVKSKAGQFHPQDLSMVLNAFFHFGTQWQWFVDNDLADRLIKSVKSNADGFNTADLSMVLNAFFHLGITRWQWFVDKGLANKLLESVNSKVEQFNPKDLSMVLNAFFHFETKWQWFVDQDLADRIIKSVKNKAEQFNPKDLSLILNAFHHFGITKWQWFVDKDLADRLIKSVKSKAKQFNPQDLSMVLNAFSHLGTQWQWFVDNDLADRLIESVKSKAEEFYPQDLALVLNAFSHFGITKWQWFLEKKLAECLLRSIKKHLQFKQFHLEEISVVLKSFVLIGINNTILESHGITKLAIRENLQSILEERIDGKHVRVCLIGLAGLDDDLIEIPSLIKLFNVALRVPYLTPASAALLINCLVTYKKYATELKSIFMEVCEGICSIGRYNDALQQQLRKNLNDLAAKPEWQKMLKDRLEPAFVPVLDIPDAEISVELNQDVLPEEAPSTRKRAREEETVLNTEMPQPRVQRRRVVVESSGEEIAPLSQPASMARQGVRQPTRVANRIRAASLVPQTQQTALYNLINESNLEGLRVLLGLQDKRLPSERTHKGSQSRSTPRQSNNTRTQAGRGQSIERIVEDFLTHTGAKELRQLISHAEHSYFELLLDACTIHTRYELIQKRLFDPVIIYLPLNQLKLFIEQLISPFAVYRDNQSLRRVINALLIRFDRNPREQSVILALQKTLIGKGLDYHSCHATVLGTLRGVERAIENKNLRIMDDEEESELSYADSFEESSLINVQYSYQADDVIAILRCKFINHSNIFILNALSFEDEPINIKACIAPHLDEMEAGTQYMIIPIQSHNHWSGLLIKFEDKCIQSMLNINIDNLNPVQSRPRFIFTDCPVIDYRFAKQGLSSSAVYFIENVANMIGGMQFSKSEQTTRVKHMHILQEHNPEHYEVYVARQFARPRSGNNASLAIGPQQSSYVGLTGAYTAEQMQITLEGVIRKLPNPASIHVAIICSGAKVEDEISEALVSV